MNLDPLFASAAAVVLSAVSVGVTVARRKNHVVEGLRSELDLALDENERLLVELNETREALHAVTAKISPDVLMQYAKQAVAYSEQLGGTGKEKLLRAVEAAQKLDAGDNGKRDWSDAQIRIAIEAVVGAK